MFTPIKNKRVYEHVIEQIQNMIMIGKLKKGDKLPSERELCDQLGVSRTSIREALRGLEIIGLIESRQGEGNFIRNNIENNFFEPLSVMFMLNKDKPEDILELRMIIEVGAAFLAASRITKEQGEELYYLLNKLEMTEDEKERAKIDKELHYKIAQITGNYFVINLLNSISTLMESFIKYAREVILKTVDNNKLLVEQHRSICDAIVNNDPLGASAAMREHLELINKNLEK